MKTAKEWDKAWYNAIKYPTHREFIAAIITDAQQHERERCVAVIEKKIKYISWHQKWSLLRRWHTEYAFRSAISAIKEME